MLCRCPGVAVDWLQNGVVARGITPADRPKPSASLVPQSCCTLLPGFRVQLILLKAVGRSVNGTFSPTNAACKLVAAGACRQAGGSMHTSQPALSDACTIALLPSLHLKSIVSMGSAPRVPGAQAHASPNPASRRPAAASRPGRLKQRFIAYLSFGARHGPCRGAAKPECGFMSPLC